MYLLHFCVAVGKLNISSAAYVQVFAMVTILLLVQASTHWGRTLPVLTCPSSALFLEEVVARQLVQFVSSSSPLIGKCPAVLLAKACQVRGKADLGELSPRRVSLTNCLVVCTTNYYQVLIEEWQNFITSCTQHRSLYWHLWHQEFFLF